MKIITIILIFFCRITFASSDTCYWMLMSEGKKIIETSNRTLYFITDNQYSSNQSLIVFETSISELINSYYSMNDKVIPEGINRIYIDFRVLTDSNLTTNVIIRNIKVVENGRIVQLEESYNQLEMLISEAGYSILHNVHYNKESTDLFFTLIFRRQPMLNNKTN